VRHAQKPADEDQYSQKSETQKQNFIKGLLSDPVLTPSMINSPKAKEIFAFLNGSEIQKNIIELANSNTSFFSGTIAKMNPEIRAQIKALGSLKVEAVQSATAQKANNSIDATLVMDFDQIYNSLNRQEKTALGKAVKNDIPEAVKILMRNGIKVEDAEKIIKFLKSNEGRIHVKDLKQAERVKRALENLKSNGLISDDLYKSLNADIIKQIQIFRNESNTLKINQMDSENSVSDSEGVDLSTSIKQYTSSAIDILLKSDSKQKIDQLLLETRKLINKLFEYEDKARKENKIESNKEETKKTEARIEEKRIASSKNLNSVNKLFTVMENIEKMAAKYTDQNLNKVLSNIKTEMTDVSKRTNLSETEKLTMMTDLLNQVLKKVLENNEEKKLDNKNPLDEKEIKKTVADVFSRLGAVFGLASGRKPDNSTQQVLNSLETSDSNSKSKRSTNSILSEIKVAVKYIFDELTAQRTRNLSKDDQELFLRRISKDIDDITNKLQFSTKDLEGTKKILDDLEKFGSKINSVLEKSKA
jgi:hypothetical protein